jgi:ectoine hydroxylase-related dioxygenase (phytanoyl-CoA dioxygenase family)
VKLSEQRVRQFWEDGVLIVENLLDEAEVETLRKRAEWVASGQASHISKGQLQVEPRVSKGELQADTYADSLRKMSHLAFHDEVFQTHARNPKVLGVIESLLGPDLKLYQDQLFMKPPKVGSRQRYHQDMPLGFTIDPPDMVTCWAALDDSTEENGCLRMLPGTHRFGIIDKSKWEEYEQRALAGDLPEERPLVMRSGSCSFHHGLILHSSQPNLSERRRWGYATHYVSARCRYTGPPEKNDAMLVRGREIPGCI